MKTKRTSTAGHARPQPAQSLLPLWLRMGREYNCRLQQWQLPINFTIPLLKLHLHADVSEPAALAEASSLPRQTITFVLDALEKRELAYRTPHPNDRRRKIIQLSPKGRKLATALYKELLAFEAAALQSLGETAAPMLHQLVARFTDALAAENRRHA